MRELALVLAICSISSQAFADVYGNNLQRQKPAEYQNYVNSVQRSVPKSARNQEWISKLSGVAGPLQRSKINGKPVLTGWVCKPHECDTNKVYLIVDQGRTAALIETSEIDMKTDTYDTQYYYVGQMSYEERRCLNYMQTNMEETC